MDLTLARRSRRESGAAAVETALVLPVVLLLTLGFIEIALLLRDYTAVSNVVRDAARVASAAPRVGNVAGHAGEAPPIGIAPDGADPSFAFLASEVVRTRGSALPQDSIVDLWVYKANRQGFPTTSDNWKTDTNTSFDPSACVAANCVRYAWTPPTETTPGFFGLVGAPDTVNNLPWDPQSINACPSTVASTVDPTSIPDAEAVGVFLRIDHRGVTNAFFNADATITDRSVIKFEPMRPTNCK